MSKELFPISLIPLAGIPQTKLNRNKADTLRIGFNYCIPKTPGSARGSKKLEL